MQIATDLEFRRLAANAKQRARYRLQKDNPIIHAKLNARSLARYNSKKNDPLFCEKRRARDRAVYHAKKQDPGFITRENIRNLARYHAKKNVLEYREKRYSKKRIAERIRMKDPSYRMRARLASRLYAALLGKHKSARTLELLGCSIEFLREHLEKQFVPGMSWENYGPVWHVDHILPCAEFHLQHSEEQEICFHWTNLQPLFAKENISKGKKIILWK